VLNTPAQADGSESLYIDGRRVIHKDGLVWRPSPDWHIRGPMLTDMWGGIVTQAKNMSPKDQKLWYSNYRIYIPEGPC
jgi:hypothetical protein